MQGSGHRPWREPWVSAWLARLGRRGALSGHARALPASGLSAPHPPATTVQVGANPTRVIADPATHTVYVADGGSGAVSVINAVTCNATSTSACGQTPATISVGNGPLGLALNHKTHTLYVTNSGDNTVSVINAATCNATSTSGCGQTPATIAVGSGPGVLAVDQATDTIYVPNSNGNTVSVINGATCNATDTSRCGQAPATVTVGSGPGQVAIDKASHTVYVGNFNDGTVSVFNEATCNAQNTSGCGQAPATVTAGNGSGNLLVDPAVSTVYVANFGDSTISMISTATCNAQNTSGCGHTPPTTPTGTGPLWVTLNPLTHTPYTANQEDSNASAVNAAPATPPPPPGAARGRRPWRWDSTPAARQPTRPPTPSMAPARTTAPSRC
jgi:YVTN family beta-propeller protein